MYRKDQTYKIFIGFIFIISCVSCFPLIKTSCVPPINQDIFCKLFKSDNEPILVLPFWEKYPVIMSEKSMSESSTLSAHTPFFLKAKDIQEIHNLIPCKISAGMILGPGGAIGRAVSFYGVLIISESGQTLWHDSHGSTISHFISQEEKDELIRIFGKGKEVYSSRSRWLLRLDGQKLNIKYSSKEKKKIINFINIIDFSF